MSFDLELATAVTLADCDSAIARYEAAGYENHNTALVEIKRRKNSLLPISRLHRELLHHVFHLALPDRQFGSSHPPPSFLYYKALSAIRKVSHSWDNETRSASSFWTFISIALPRPFRDLIWERSGDAPLDVDTSRSSYMYGVEGYIDHWNETEWAYLERVAKRGIRQLFLTVPPAENPDPYIVGCSHPWMTSLSIEAERYYAIHTVSNPLQTPQLANLNLDGCNVPWDHLHNLRSLSLCRTDGPNLAQLVRILRSSPQLETLSLDYVKPPSEDLSSETIGGTLINLPQLSTVNIRDVPFSLVSGLVDGMLPLNTYCTFSINIFTGEDIDLSGFFRQVGRLCIPPVGEVLQPQLSMGWGELGLRTTSYRSVCIRKRNWNYQENSSTLSWRAQLARAFFEPGRRVLSEAPISRAVVWVDCAEAKTEGLAIMHEFFPKAKTVESQDLNEEVMDEWA
ncbi:hypothetical protein FRC04_006309 [Tulasnella sp. 424]|nr:hypothetical protein FRC04_006309 [Tulasnella sp. 424]KAG8980362.1 hypothetical protein FRC05_005993 [Tulasnella sp. 425]